MLDKDAAVDMLVYDPKWLGQVWRYDGPTEPEGVKTNQPRCRRAAPNSAWTFGSAARGCGPHADVPPRRGEVTLK